MNSLYLWINIGTIAFPFLFSFEKKVAFYKKWIFLFPSLIITGLFFLGWDQWFTEMNIWGFNSKYILGYYIFDIPVEEILFFFTVPYACVFIYEALRAYIRQNETFEELYRWFSLLFFGISCTLLYWYNDRLYTAITCLVVSMILGTHLMVIRRRYMSWFYFAYAVSIIPMLIVNGILTAKPVVFYNDKENIGLRLMTIPVEDFLYNLAMLSICIGLYEWFKRIGLRYRLRHEKHAEAVA
jgi:lycopene cyclase domain-containing protein